jgi:hypothetical protein
MQRLVEGNDPKCDPKDSISIERAKAITDVAQTIVNSAKVQCDFLKSVMKETTVNIDKDKQLFLGA